jgi:hypothetical protein
MSKSKEFDQKYSHILSIQNETKDLIIVLINGDI